MSKGQRKVVSISLSPSNANAMIVVRGLVGVPKGERSAKILEWAAAHLEGKTAAAQLVEAVQELSDDDLDAALDNF